MGRTQNLGLQELMKKAGVRTQPTPSVCGFALGPRLNASGRLAEAQKGCKLLMTQDRSEAKSIADELDRLNAQRQKLEQEVLEAAETMLSQVFDVQHDRCIVVGSRDWHQGVVGIVASRLQRRYHRPAIVISVDENGKGKGSCRTVDGCSLMSALEGCRQHLIQYGGHVMAAGLEIQEQNIEQFRVSLNQWLAENITDDCFAEHVHIDMELRGDELSEELCEKLALLEPFGKSNPSPIFAVCNVDIISPMRVISGKHLSFRARANQVNFDVIGFGCAHRRFTETRVDLAGHWELDDYTGEPCLRMVDWRSAVE
jgi:single-stranded-DNA-specific exonuclease